MKRLLPSTVKFLLLVLLALHPVSVRADSGISMQLNKLEPVAQGCRVYMVFTNGTSATLSSFKPDLVFFNREGVIADRLVVEGGPLAPGKTRVRLFDVAKLACADIARVLLNDLRTCQNTTENTDQNTKRDPADCLAMTTTSSLNAVEFIK
ncbi:MAG: Tat pathway signal sequence domain protein [Rhodospirillales bacterium]